MHRCLVVAAEDTREVIDIAQHVSAKGRNTHMLHKSWRQQQIGSCDGIIVRKGMRNTCRHLALIIDTDVSSHLHRRIVTTAIDVADGTALDFNISLVEFGAFHLVIRIIRDAVLQLLTCIVVVAITATKDITNKERILISFGIFSFWTNAHEGIIVVPIHTLLICNTIGYLVLNGCGDIF